MRGEVEAAGSINELLLGDGEVGEDCEAGHVDLRGRNIKGVGVTGGHRHHHHHHCTSLTSRMASSSAREAMARISDEGLKVREVAEVSRFITTFRGLGLAEFRHASWE